MKKLLISGYFVGMLLLTYITAKAVGTYKSDNVEVKYQNYEKELSDTEINQYGIQPKEGKNVVMKWKTKETRTKKLFGWDTQVETIEQPSTWYEDCNCN